jgi:hypothetical protein
MERRGRRGRRGIGASWHAMLFENGDVPPKREPSPQKGVIEIESPQGALALDRVIAYLQDWGLERHEVRLEKRRERPPRKGELVEREEGPVISPLIVEVRHPDSDSSFTVQVPAEGRSRQLTVHVNWPGSLEAKRARIKVAGGRLNLNSLQKKRRLTMEGADSFLNELFSLLGKKGLILALREKSFSRSWETIAELSEERRTELEKHSLLDLASSETASFLRQIEIIRLALGGELGTNVEVREKDGGLLIARRRDRVVVSVSEDSLGDKIFLRPARDDSRQIELLARGEGGEPEVSRIIQKEEDKKIVVRGLEEEEIDFVSLEVFFTDEIGQVLSEENKNILEVERLGEGGLMFRLTQGESLREFQAVFSGVTDSGFRDDSFGSDVHFWYREGSVGLFEYRGFNDTRIEIKDPEGDILLMKRPQESVLFHYSPLDPDRIEVIVELARGDLKLRKILKRVLFEFGGITGKMVRFPDRSRQRQERWGLW